MAKHSKGPTLPAPRPDPASGLVRIVFFERRLVKDHLGAIVDDYAEGLPGYELVPSRAAYFVELGEAEYAETMAAVTGPSVAPETKQKAKAEAHAPRDEKPPHSVEGGDAGAGVR